MRWPRRRRYAQLPKPIYGFEDLARYHADKARGVMFTAEAEAHYAEREAEHQRLINEAHEAAGWTRAGDHWMIPAPNSDNEKEKT